MSHKIKGIDVQNNLSGLLRNSRGLSVWHTCYKFSYITSVGLELKKYHHLVATNLEIN